MHIVTEANCYSAIRLCNSTTTNSPFSFSHILHWIIILTKIMNNVFLFKFLILDDFIHLKTFAQHEIQGFECYTSQNIHAILTTIVPVCFWII